MKRLVSYFLQGLVFLLPIVLTIWLVGSVFLTLDRLILELLALFGVRHLPGVGVFVLIVLVTAVGFMGSNFLTRGLLRTVDRVLQQLPFVKLLHGALRDLMDAFVGDKKKFDKPVLVDLAAGGQVRALGFVTREALDGYGLPDHVAVYLPQAYNFAGQLLIVPRAAVTPLPLESGEVMATIVSGGVTGR